ncbi:hypothetical protein ACHAWO_001180 [Cyclotella atomus]|uniref:Uncharacterized protein n=1 Tax=Cyclotella atomus TaxID=382360 RepID=A0ABD3NG10_9STRA
MATGFHINEDGERVPMDYCSHDERLYCEASELYEHKHYKEAHAKMDWYLEFSGGQFSIHHAKFIFKIELGNLRAELNEQNVKNCVSTWRMVAGSAMEYDDYYEMKENAFLIANRYCELEGYPINFDKENPGDMYSCEDFNDETDMIDPILVGMRHAVDANTPDSSNVINTSSIVQVKHDLMRYLPYVQGVHEELGFY